MAKGVVTAPALVSGILMDCGRWASIKIPMTAKVTAIVAGLTIFKRRLAMDMAFSLSVGAVKLTPTVHSRSWSTTVNKAI